MNTGADCGARGWSTVDRRLTDLGVPASLRSELGEVFSKQPVEAALLYGSWARGDADEDSDLDLVLVERNAGHSTVLAGQLSVARYNSRELSDLSGTLFGFHLVRDGIILHDTDDQLVQALAAIHPPEPGSVIARVRSLAQVLDVSAAERIKYIEGLTKVARYLLRTAMYAQALDEEAPCFSVRELAARNNDPALVAVLSSHESVRPAASVEVLDDICGRLAAVIGELQSNPFGTLHGLIEGSWVDSRELSNFATLVLAGEGDELPYDELPRVTL